MRTRMMHKLQLITGIALMLASILTFHGGSMEKVIIIQPCLSNNISIMRSNDYSSIEQPLVITSGYRIDGKQPSDERGLLKFDLSKIPGGWRVKKAQLELYVIGTYVWNGSKNEWQPIPSLNRVIYVNRISKDWIGWSFTYWSYSAFPDSLWDNPGGDFAPSNVKVCFEHPRSWNIWIVTEDVRAWYERGEPNYGWLLKDADEGNSVGYRVEYMNWFYVWDVKYSPKLVVHLVKDDARYMDTLGMASMLFGLSILVQGCVDLFRNRMPVEE